MKRETPRHVAIWIDAHQAILLAFEADACDRSILYGPGEGWSQDRVGVEQYSSKQQYYDTVISHLEPQDEILLLGPGEAKRELRRQIEQYGSLKGTVVGFREAPELAEVELVFPTGEGGAPRKRRASPTSPASSPAHNRLPWAEGRGQTGSVMHLKGNLRQA